MWISMAIKDSKLPPPMGRPVPPPPPPPPYGYPYPYPPPPYPYPYPPPFVPSVYGELYTRPQEEPRIRFDVLLKVFYSPKEAFVEIYHSTTKIQGIFVTLIFTLILSFFTIISYIQTAFIPGSFGSSSFLPYGDSLMIASASQAFAIPLAIISLYIMGYLSAAVSQGLGGLRKDVDKTMGLLGYGVIVTFIFGLIQLVLVMILSVTVLSDDSISGDFAVLGIAGVIGIISFFWSLWVNGTAVSVATDTTVAKGILSYFLALIVVVIFATIISMFAFVFFMFGMM